MTPAWGERLRAEAETRAQKSLARRLRPVEPAQGGRLSLGAGGPPLLDLCSNDYLGLAHHPAVTEGAREALGRYGSGARASRLVTGDYALLGELEAELAAFKGTETALVFPSGYQANLGLLSLLLQPDDAVFADRLAHACLVDGVRLSPARLRVFPHNDTARLAELLASAAEAPARWILADGIYSMDGDFAPLPELLRLAEEYDATLVLDDAHGTGVAGPNGRGTAEHFGIDPRAHADRLIVVATLSKALGSQGGAVCGSALLREAIINASRPFVYSTGLAPAAAGAALAAIRLIRSEPHRPRNLSALAAEIRAEMRARGLDLLGSQSPVIPIVVGEADRALALSAALQAEGLLVLPIRPPTVPRGTSRLRLTVNSAIDEALLRSACRLAADRCTGQHPTESPR